MKAEAVPFCGAIKAVRSEKLDVRNGGSGAQYLEAPHFLLSDDNPNNQQLTTHNTNYKNILREYGKIGGRIYGIGKKGMVK